MKQPREAAAPGPAGGREIDLSRVLERRELGGFRRRVLLLCWLIAVIDGFDVQAMAFVAPVLARTWQIPSTLMGQILTASLIGLMIGSLSLGRLSDRVGRRKVLIASVILFGAGSLVTALSTNVTQLMITRCITGIGLGGAIVASLALTAEYAPPRSRATLVTAMFVGFPLGGSIGGLTAAPLIALAGWQGVFVLGGIAPLLLIVMIWRLLPESLQFQVTQGADARAVGAIVERIDPLHRHRDGDRYVLQEPPANSSTIAELFREGRLAGTALLWLICFANLLVLYLLINWLPSILHQTGLTLSMANLGAVIFNLGGVVGGLALSVAVDRLGAFRVLALAYCATAIVILTLAQTGETTMAFALTAVAGAGIMGSQFCINALASAFYPTAIRSTGVGCALGVGRIGSIVGPVAGGFALASGATKAAVFAGLAVPIVACSVAVLLLAVAYRRAIHTATPGMPIDTPNRESAT